MTKYRTISYGHFTYLEYLDGDCWKRIWKPYYNLGAGRQTRCEEKLYICSYVDDFHFFVESWPDVSEYFKWANEKQAELEKYAQRYWQRIESSDGNKGEIKYLN